jgi:hypothetical protein
MIKGTLSEFKNFIENLSTGIAGVNKFLYGDALKIVAYSRSNPQFGYPLIHLNRPIVVAENNGFGNQTTVFYAEIVAMTKVDKTGKANDHDAKELLADGQALTILLELERKLRLSSQDDVIDFETNTEIEPTLPGWIDGHIGWKMTCKITLAANSQQCR